MLKWWNGSSNTAVIGGSNDNDDEVQSPSLFPMPGSIQRVGGKGEARQQQEEDSEDEDDDDEDRNAIASMDVHISPPSPVQAAAPPSITVSNNATEKAVPTKQQMEQKIKQDDEFKAPSFSLSISSPSSTVPNLTKTKPKPSHRPFPPEPAAPQTLNNGRVTLMNGGSVKPGQSLGSSLGLPPSTTVKPRKQRFVALEPGYSPLDWARLNREGDDYELRCGFDKPQKFTLTEVSEHATQTDAWSVFHGKVYNITPYLHFHPGGVKELMRVAGKDGTELFMQTHAWVNAELMMEGCLIGFLVRE